MLVGRPEREALAGPPLSTRRVVVQLVAGILVVLAAVTIGGSLAARRLAEREAVNDAAQIADVLAETVIQPELSDALFAGSPAALRRFDQLVRDRVLGDNVVRVKIWSPEGKVIYSDQPELVGRTFPLEAEEREVLTEPRTVAEISDLDRAENSLDREIGDKLVEVYRPVWTTTGQEALFEIYAPYDQVGQRTGQLWRGFAGVTLSSLLLFVVLVAPLVWHLLSRVRRSQRQRELLLQRAVDASDAERRRIAATLHDGPVQDLAATSFVIAGATAHAESAGRTRLAEELHQVAGSVRTSIRALRSLLVDIYPPSLAQAGLPVALTDLAQTVRAPGLTVVVQPVQDAELGLRPDQERLVYRVAQETLRNAAKHATPCTVHVSLRREGADVVLDVVDDGRGFDPTATLADPEHGHFGLQLLAELAATGGATLQVASAPGQGTHWGAAGAPRLVLRRGDRAMTRVLLVDDHAMVRTGIATLLGVTDDLEVVGQASDGEEAVSVAVETRPDVVLMDLSMPGVDGVEATRRILAAQPEVRIVVLTSFSDRDRVSDALAAGAVGYQLKDCEPADLLDGRALRGGRARPDRPQGRGRPAPRGQGQPTRGPGQPSGDGGAPAGRRGDGQQADRPPAGDQRTHRQGAPGARLPTDRRRRPDECGHVGTRPPGQVPRLRLTRRAGARAPPRDRPCVRHRRRPPPRTRCRPRRAGRAPGRAGPGRSAGRGRARGSSACRTPPW